ncbi:hypothetical protein MY11210_008506 [Beauveria gryllotalpidicola]
MGGGGNSHQVLVNATADAIAQLVKWAAFFGGSANNQGKATGSQGEEAQKLQKTLENAATYQFGIVYEYPYNGPNTSPPEWDSRYGKFPHTQLVNCKANDNAALREYINNVLAANVPADESYRADFANSILATVTPFLTDGTAGFKVIHYTTPIHGSHPASKDVLQVDAIIIYAQAKTDQGSDEKRLFLQYCGIAYFKQIEVPPLA